MQHGPYQPSYDELRNRFSSVHPDLEQNPEFRNAEEWRHVTGHLGGINDFAVVDVPRHAIVSLAATMAWVREQGLVPASYEETLHWLVHHHSDRRLLACRSVVFIRRVRAVAYFCESEHGRTLGLVWDGDGAHLECSVLVRSAA